MVLFFSLLSILFLLSTYFVNTRLKISFLPSKEECYIKGRTVQVDKLKKKHFQSEAVFPLRFGTRLFCEERAEFERLNQINNFTWRKGCRHLSELAMCL